MSQENVEIVQRAFEAYEREGMDGYLRYLDPEIEWTTTGDYIEAATYRGHAGVRRYLGEMEAEFEDLRVEPLELIDAVTGRGRGKRSKVPVETPYWFVTKLRDGLAVRVETYVDPKEAAKAAGLSE